MNAVPAVPNATVLSGLIESLAAMTGAQRPATLVDWATSPELVTVDQAAFLLGVDLATLQAIIDAGGVDLVDQGDDALIDLGSLRDFWETYWELAHDDAYLHD